MTTTDRPAGARTRRRHAATGGRILAASLSASAALGLMAVMGGASSSATGGAPTPVRPSPEGIVVVIRSSPGPVRSVAAAPTVTASTATPVTTSQAS